MNSKYKHIFFDLDRTLWDFDRNSKETLQELFSEVDLPARGISSFEMFLEIYHQVNTGLWEEYRDGRISQAVLRPRRFDLTFQHFGIHDPALAAWFGEEYLRRSAKRNDVFPGALDLIEELHKHFHLHIITNGFADVQYAKLSQSGLARFFQTVVTSEEAGIHKPDPGIFHFALDKGEALASESLMVGDDPYMDIEGARMAGMDQVWYNPHKVEAKVLPTYTIESLEEIRRIVFYS